MKAFDTWRPVSGEVHDLRDTIRVRDIYVGLGFDTAIRFADMGTSRLYVRWPRRFHRHNGDRMATVEP